MNESPPPKVFISYSHDSPEHEQNVLEFSERLRADGIETRIDQYKPWPEEGWPKWMERHLREADFVLMVCTETYHRRVTGEEDPGTGKGVCWEANLIYNDLYTKKQFTPKYIPILFEGGTEKHIPSVLSGHTFHSVHSQQGYEDLYRQLTNQPKAEPSPLGKVQKLPGLRSMSKTTAFVPGHTHDIFVSYAHIDNDPRPGIEEGWVSTLIKGLRTGLSQKLGDRNAYSLWFDPQLSKIEKITPSILEEINSSALLLVILSPGYLASEWCQLEREAFLKTQSSNKSSESRFIIVERDRISESERSREFRDVLGYRFWGVDKEGAAPRTLGDPTPNPDDPRYYDLLNDLCSDVASKLGRLRKQATPKPDPTSASNGQPTVYLADSTEDLFSTYDEVKRYLSQKGVKVYPEKNLFTGNLEDYQKAVKKELEKTQIFIQLLSEFSGKLSPDSLGSCRLQYKEALKAKKQIYQWRKPQLVLDPKKITDNDHLSLLNENSVQAVNLESFKKYVSEKATSKYNRTKTKKDVILFLNADKSDQPHAEEVAEIMQQSDIGHFLPIWESDEAETNLEDLNNCILNCDGMIIIYGSVTPVWVRKQILYCHRLIFRRVTPLQIRAICDGPPEDKTDLNFKLPDWQIVDCRNGITADKFHSLIHNLKPEPV